MIVMEKRRNKGTEIKRRKRMLEGGRQVGRQVCAAAAKVTEVAVPLCPRVVLCHHAADHLPRPDR